MTPALPASPLWDAVHAATRRPEPEAVAALLPAATLAPEQAAAAQALALKLAQGVRERSRAAGRAGLVQGLLQEFALSSQEGVALMCLAEALLRIPDSATRDALIRDKIGRGQWQQHLGRSPSLFVNAATWGLLITGRLVATHSDTGLSAALMRTVGRGGEPLVRRGVDMAMRLMGEQFVCGETIHAALANAAPREAEGFSHSYDMLGEAALTAADAAAYTAAYEQAIHAIGRAAAGRGVVAGPGISVKLSALHPRYARAQVQRVMAELYPRLQALAVQARQHDIGLNIDAEESERLTLSLALLQRLCQDPALAGWQGLGFVVQAYQKRCPAVVAWLVELARASGRRLMVRLVKGAYWDSEVKRAQQEGQAGYPVYTRKVHTDVSYLACARALLAAPDAVYPQFATHNAHTVAAVLQMAGPDFQPGRYEFQCLHGMGEPLYRQVVGPEGLNRPCRIYAPVGPHDTLLAYLVRRLLENGANTSFVNRVASDDVPLADLVQDPAEQVRHSTAPGAPHPGIPLPAALYGPARTNALGLDLAHEPTLTTLAETLRACQPPPVPDATPAQVQAALARAHDPAWPALAPAARAAALERAAALMQARLPALAALMVREAHKTWPNAVAEVREAIDFLRYDAAQVRSGWDNTTHVPLGPVLCISPWNFPLAIFTGQVAAALAAGNTVLAKPAEQTPQTAAAAVALLHEAGVPAAALQLLPGPGHSVGAALVAAPVVQGVLFTGSTEVARLIQHTLAQRLGTHGAPVPLVAETGGCNALVVDSSALPEQVVADVLASAFDSAGQRCSALRLLCVQADGAERLLRMLQGAMCELRLGAPNELATDVGPVIDAEAQAGIVHHLQAMREQGHAVWQPEAAANALPAGLVPPTLVTLESATQLTREVFGPVLHVLRYEREALPTLLAQVNAAGYGLTGGVHSRIDETVAQVVQGLRVGNLYVNRNLVGAVVGVQPFGGEGLSGTGPKAGGPLALLRLLARRPEGAARQAVQASGPPATPPVRGLAAEPASDAGAALRAWAQARGDTALAEACERHAAHSPCSGWRTLPGPTGEANLYAVLPRERVLCLADDDSARLQQLAAVLALGGQALWPAQAQALHQRLPAEVQDRVALAQDWAEPSVPVDAVLHTGTAEALIALAQQLARRPGALVPLVPMDSHGQTTLEALVTERSLSINTAAAGGNASLMATG